MNETQRIFLVSPDIERWLEKQIASYEKTELFYLDATTYYIKHFPNTYIQVRDEGEDKEQKTDVSQEQYKLARSQHIGRKVVKKIYTIEIEQQKFVVMKYMKNLKGIYILLVFKVAGKTTGNSVTLDSLQPLLLKIIDSDEKYTDRSLAMCAEVMEYSQDKLFEQLDAYEAVNLFFWQVPKRIYVRDGVALVLYRNLRLLRHYKANYQHKHFSASLHRLRVIMRRSATLLETFSSFFSPNIHRFCIDLLLHYHEETKLLRYLYFLDELAQNTENVQAVLQKELKDLIYHEHKASSQMLLEQPFQQLVQIFTREIQEKDLHPCASLEDEVKKAARKHLAELETLIQKCKEGYDEEMLEQLYTAIDSLQTLIEDFFQILGEKETHIIVDELNILLKPLREYKNCKEREEILHAIKSQSAVDKELDINPLLCANVKELKEKIDNALTLLSASRFYV